MNCFNHPDRPAVGFCKACCRGLCHDCAAIVPYGLACSSACGQRVELLNGIVDNNAKNVAVANRQTRLAGIFILMMGLFLCLVAVLPVLTSGDWRCIYLGILGGPFVVYGCLRLLRSSSYLSPARSPVGQARACLTASSDS